MLGLEETVSTGYNVDIFWNKLLDKFYNQGIEFYSELRVLDSFIELNTSTKQEIKVHLDITPASGGGVQSGGARVDPKILKHIEDQKIELIYMVARVKLWDRNIDSLIKKTGELENVLIDNVKYNRKTFLQLYNFEEYLEKQSMTVYTPEDLTEKIKKIMYIRGSSSAQNEIDIIKKDLLKFVKYTCIPNLLEGGGTESNVYATNFRLDLNIFLKARIKYILKNKPDLITPSNVHSSEEDLKDLNGFLTKKFFGKKKKIINTEQSEAVVDFGRTLMRWCGYYIESLRSSLQLDYTPPGWFEKELDSMMSGTVSDAKLRDWMLLELLSEKYTPNTIYQFLPGTSSHFNAVKEKPLRKDSADKVRRLAESIYNDKLFGNNAANIPNYSEETRLNERATKGKLMEDKDRVNFNIVNIADPAPGTNWRNPITRNGHECKIEVKGKSDTFVAFKYTNGGTDVERQITLNKATLYYQVNINSIPIHRQDIHLGGGGSTGIRVFDGSDNNLSKQRTINSVFKYLGDVYENTGWESNSDDAMTILNNFNRPRKTLNFDEIANDKIVNDKIVNDEIAKNVMGIFMRKQFGDGGQELFMLQYLLKGNNAALVGNDWPSYCRLLFLINEFKDGIKNRFMVGFWGTSTLHMVTSNIFIFGGGKKRKSRRTSRRSRKTSRKSTRRSRRTTRRSRRTSRKTTRRSRRTSRRKSTRRSRRTSRRKTTRKSRRTSRRKTTRKSRRTSRKTTRKTTRRSRKTTRRSRRTSRKR